MLVAGVDPWSQFSFLRFVLEVRISFRRFIGSYAHVDQFAYHADENTDSVCNRV